MTRRIIWITLALIAAVAAGLLLGVIIPASSNDSPPQTVIVNKTIIPAGTPSSLPLSRKLVMEWFARHGEPLALRLDVAEANPDAPVDAIFVPAKQDVPEPPFELTLFDDVKSAEKQARSLEAEAGSHGQVARLRNVVLLVSRMESAERRARLISTLESLS